MSAQVTDGRTASARPAGRQGAARPPGPPGAFATGAVVARDLGPFALDDGAVLPALRIAYRHDGPGPDAAPQVLVVHALTGSADAAGDWWAPLIGPGRALDTRRVGVLCANLLGGCYGTTGPTSRDPATGVAYGASFPAVSARDEARAQWALLDALGIERLALVTGGSLGGMVALEVALERPAAVGAVIPIAAPAATGALALAWNAIQLELVGRLGSEGLDLARRLAMTTYRSEADFAERFGRATEPDGTPSVASYLAHQGRKLVGRFDPEAYRVLVGAMDRHDVGAGRGGVVAALGRLAGGGTRLVGLGIEGDILYGPGQVRSLVEAAAAAGADARYRELRSAKGHDAFLVEWEQLAALVGEVLGDELVARPARATSAVRPM
ncbi:MAG: homoserine O-acetyltransferase [Chloroflexi bacterium]|nr:homoserine O-acetyltransferase [Chloroflexota bacterium]